MQGSFSWTRSCQRFCPVPHPHKLAFTLPPVGSCPVCLLHPQPASRPCLTRCQCQPQTRLSGGADSRLDNGRENPPLCLINEPSLHGTWGPNLGLWRGGESGELGAETNIQQTLHTGTMVRGSHA